MTCPNCGSDLFEVIGWRGLSLLMRCQACGENYLDYMYGQQEERSFSSI